MLKFWKARLNAHSDVTLRLILTLVRHARCSPIITKAEMGRVHYLLGPNFWFDLLMWTFALFVKEPEPI